MKKIFGLLIGIFVISYFSLQAKNAEDSCAIRLTSEIAQAILDSVNIIKPKVCAIQEEIENLIVIAEVSGLDELVTQLSLVEENLCSKIENIMVTVEVSGIEELSQQLSQVEVDLCSKIDNLVVTTEVSGIDELSLQLSETDASLCSKIGMLDADGSCLDSMITVPTDINNLQLSVVSLLKTLLLELRGCSN